MPYCFQNSLKIFCGLCHKSKLFSGQADAQGIAEDAENLRLELRSQLSAFIWRNSNMVTASESLTSTRGGRIQIPKEKLLDYLNQRDCLPLVMLLLARSHGRATVLTDPFIRLRPGQQLLKGPASHFMTVRLLRSALFVPYILSSHQMATRERRQAQTMGTWALDQGVAILA